MEPCDGSVSDLDNLDRRQKHQECKYDSSLAITVHNLRLHIEERRGIA
jgi:hypothetical protein